MLAHHDGSEDGVTRCSEGGEGVMLVAGQSDWHRRPDYGQVRVDWYGRHGTSFRHLAFNFTDLLDERKLESETNDFVRLVRPEPVTGLSLDGDLSPSRWRRTRSPLTTTPPVMFIIVRRYPSRLARLPD
jgi:hypothetical protein